MREGTTPARTLNARRRTLRQDYSAAPPVAGSRRSVASNTVSPGMEEARTSVPPCAPATQSARREAQAGPTALGFGVARVRRLAR